MHKFYGSDNCNVKPIDESYSKIENPRIMYDLLSDIWCEYTCAPRLRKGYAESHRTLGQCSITSFLVQDVFGGEVYGVPLEDGSYHCYNVIGDALFDLTSEQFDWTCEYKKENPQTREEHFKSEEKYQRYCYLKDKLNEAIENHG